MERKLIDITDLSPHELFREELYRNSPASRTFVDRFVGELKKEEVGNLYLIDALEMAILIYSEYVFEKEKLPRT